MNFNDLFELDLPEYLLNAFVPGQMIVYAHIPKCSGTSSLIALKQLYERVWHFDYASIDEKWDQFLERAKSDTYRHLELAAGHFWHWHLASLRENDVPCHKIAFLRQPIQRLVSEYRYMCTPAHPPSEQFVKDHPTFDSFVENYVHPNSIAHILYNGVNSFDDYLDRLKRDFRFIGLSEFYHLSMLILMKAIDQPYTIQPRQNVTLETAQNRFEISHHAYQRLSQSQSLDIMVYDYLYQRYAQLSDRFLGQLVEGRLSL